MAEGPRQCHELFYELRLHKQRALLPTDDFFAKHATGKSKRRLNQHISTLGEPGFLMFAEGRPLYMTEPGKPAEPVLFAADGIAISADGKELYYCPISGTKLYGVSTAALRDKSKSDADVASTVRIVTGKMPSDGLESDAEGNIYMSDPVTNSIHTFNVKTGKTETIVHDPTLLWPDTMSLTDDGYLYVTANQLNRQPTMHNGKDETGEALRSVSGKGRWTSHPPQIELIAIPAYRSKQTCRWSFTRSYSLPDT